MGRRTSRDVLRSVGGAIASAERVRDRLLEAVAGRQLWVTAAGVVLFTVYLASGPFTNSWTIPDRIAFVGSMLKGGGNLGDIAQDVVGFRRLWENRDPYPVLGPAFREIGVSWDVRHESTHPPTAFLLAAPIAYLGRALAARVWAIVCFGLLYVALRAYGVPTRVAIGLTLGLPALWGPVASSFQQLTLVWLAGVALAFRLESRSSFLAGAAVGLASLPKLLPLVVLGYFVLRRKGRAVLGTAVVWATACLAILAISPAAFSRYVAVNRENAWAMIRRSDNIALPRQAYALLGPVGVVLVALFLVALVFVNRHALVEPAAAPRYSFFLYSFLAVVLLPICWGYSLVPLLPVIGYFLVEGRGPHVVVAAAAFLQLALLRPFLCELGLSTSMLVVGCLFLIGPPHRGGGAPAFACSDDTPSVTRSLPAG